MQTETTDESPDPDAKVLFRVPRNDDSDLADVETLWAWRLGNDLYKLDNCPYFAYSVSWLDTVYAPFDEYEGFPTFQRVTEKSGYRTLRMYFDTPVEAGDDNDRILDELEGLGCDFERANRKFIVVNISKDLDLYEIANFLFDKNINFEYADPSYEEIFGEDED